MKHEQARMDAGQEVHGKGPFLDIKWDQIAASWKSQYVGSADEYMGSADDGSGDPYSGYAPYDFGSIMHYPGGPAFDTIPSYQEAFTGQRAGLAHSDIMQAWDMYQCKLKPGFTMGPTPAPATVITVAGSCDQPNFNINGDYASQGTTASGAMWYKMPTGLALYFDPKCGGATGGGSPKWVLDNDDPDLEATNDLDKDGGCMYWGKVNVASTEITYPASTQWRIYCGSDGWTTKTLTIGPWNPTPPPPPPEPTPAPTPLACVGDRNTWDSGWGGCTTYGPGSTNHPYCDKDQSGGLYCQEACSECGVCVGGGDGAPVPTPDPNACKGNADTWNAGFGGCDTYGAGSANGGYCDQDSNQGFAASDVCYECGKCTSPAADAGPATTTTPALGFSWSLDKKNKMCKSKLGKPKKKKTETQCAELCKNNKKCKKFTYRPKEKGKSKPGLCQLSKGKCTKKQMKKAKNWWTYKID